MFSSRDTKFASEILNATDGRGIDVIINSLTGEMLDESWRLCADGGTLVEIGKKDIVERNTLSMEPFDRNCSFRAMDFSYTRDISNALISRSVTTFGPFITTLKTSSQTPGSDLRFGKCWAPQANPSNYNIWL